MAAATPLSVADLRRIATERLKDAKALLKAGRYDGGVYLCGYAMETGLKARICKTLKWNEFPTNKDKYRSFFVHDLNILLNLSGREQAVRTTLLLEWSNVERWHSEARYTPPGKADKGELTTMIEATEELLKKL
jgi:hypothetical protein